MAVGDLYEREMGLLIESIERTYAGNPNLRNLSMLCGGLRESTGGPMLTLHSYRFDIQRLEAWDEWRAPPEFGSIFTHTEHRRWWPAVCLKGWWIYEIWKRVASASPLMWIDADAWVQKPLEFVFPDTEFLGAHWVNFADLDVLHSGTLLLHGPQDGVLHETLKCTAHQCWEAVRDDKPVGHQNTLRDVAKVLRCPLLSLPDSYCAIALPDRADPDPDAVIQHWGGHMARVAPGWPPPPEQRMR